MDTSTNQSRVGASWRANLIALGLMVVVVTVLLLVASYFSPLAWGWNLLVLGLMFGAVCAWFRRDQISQLLSRQQALNTPEKPVMSDETANTKPQSVSNDPGHEFSPSLDDTQPIPIDTTAQSNLDGLHGSIPPEYIALLREQRESTLEAVQAIVRAGNQPSADDYMDDEPDTIHAEAQRHWKFLLKRVWLPIFILAIWLTLLSFLVYLEVFTGVNLNMPWLFWLTLLTLTAIGGAAVTYHYLRQSFYWRNLHLQIRGDHVVQIYPDIRFPYFFKGGSINIPIWRINTVKPKPRTIWEMLIFRNVQTLTIDSAGEQDVEMHDMPDIVDANEFSGEINLRRMRLSRSGRGTPYTN